MTGFTRTITLTAALAAVAATAARAQEKAADTTPIKVHVVLTRYQGEKKTSSMPYMLTVSVNRNVSSIPGSAGGVAHLRMGSKVPVPQLISPTIDGKEMPASGPVQYHDIGTNIDCSAWLRDDGSFRVDVVVDDSSVYADEALKTSRQPTFRSFRATNSMILKDGQTGQFSSAVDKVSGEVTKVDVTLTVVK